MGRSPHKILHVLDILYRRLANPDAIVRVEMDQSAHGNQCKLVIISNGIYTAGIVDSPDWSTPDNLIEAVLQHFFAACRANSPNPTQSDWPQEE